MNRSVKLALLKKALDEKVLGALGLLGLTAGGGLLLASGAGKVNDAFADIRRRAGIPNAPKATPEATAAAIEKWKNISRPEPLASPGIGGSGGSVRK